MTIAESIVLGLTQGLTEFIPVSSTGHLVLVGQLLSGASERLFIELIHAGTLMALLVHFRVRLVDTVKRVWLKRDWRLVRNLVITTIPVGVAGLILAGVIDRLAVFESVWTVIVMLVGLGVVMILIDRLPTAKRVKNLEEMSWKQALWIGVAQMMSLVPGVSRSGATIVVGRVSGLSARDAAEYSFLAALPVMFAVLLRFVISSSGREYAIENWEIVLVGNIVSFISGLLVIGFLMKFLAKKNGLQIFGWYRVILAVVMVIVFWAAGGL